MLGYFWYDDEEDRGVICVSDALSHDGFVDTLCEEWAHARTSDLCRDEDDHHNGTFWAEYGRIVMASREQSW